MKRLLTAVIFALAASPLAAGAGTMPAACTNLYPPTHVPGMANAWVVINQVVVVPGASNAWHDHLGAEYVLLQNGSGSLVEKGHAPVALSAKHALVIEPGVDHHFVNGSKTQPLNVLIMQVAGKKVTPPTTWTKLDNTPSSTVCYPAK